MIEHVVVRHQGRSLAVRVLEASRLEDEDGPLEERVGEEGRVGIQFGMRLHVFGYPLVHGYQGTLQRGEIVNEHLL